MQIGLGIGIPFTRSQIWLAIQSFSPAKLFEDGTQGLWLDPSDLSTMFVESGASPGTLTPASLNGFVGRILDKSGRGNHAFAPTDAARPTLKQDANGCYYLLFNGSSTSMQTASINFTATDKMFVSAGVRKLSDAVANGTIVENEVTSTPGSFSINAPNTAGTATYGYYGNGGNNTGYYVASFSSPITNVLSNAIDLSGTTNLQKFGPKINGVAVTGTDIITPTPTGIKFANLPIYIGARAGSSQWFNGHLYQLVIAGKQASTAEIENTEEYVNSKTLALDWREVTDSSSFRWNSATSSPDAS